MKSKFKRNQIDEAIDGFLLACKVEGKSPFTIRFYQYKLKIFRVFVSQQGIKRMQDILPNHIRLFLAGLQDKDLAPASIHSDYAALNVLFNWLMAEGGVRRNPMQNIKRPRIPKKNIRAFSELDIRAILSLVVGKNFKCLRTRAMILLLLDTGLRLNELAKIKLTDIDLDREIIKVMGKGAKERIVRMGKVTQDSLLAYLSKRSANHPCLWVTKGGMPLKREGVQTAIRTVCCKANINGAKPSPHTFRHTFAISYLRNGGDLITLQNLLGHSNLEMTRRYLSSLNEEDLIKAHRKYSPVDNLVIT